MYSVSLTVWFVCKSCNLNFAKVADFIEHKKENHFAEFQAQNTSCVVFEERIDDDCDNESGSMDATPILLKEEFQLTNDSRIEINSDAKIVSCWDDPELTWKSVNLTAPTTDYCYGDSGQNNNSLMPNPECQSQEENTSEISSFPPKFNPYVLLKRLTSKEMHDASSANNRKWNLNSDLYIPQSFQCNQLNCGKSFKYQSHLDIHIKGHSDLRPFGCSHCHKAFKFRHHLVEHVRLHTGERPFKCPVDNCNKTFTHYKNLWSHQRRVHRIIKPFKCSVLNCRKAYYTTEEALNNHKWSSHSDPNGRPFAFACPHCVKTFKRREHLAEHVRRHTGERPYKCPFDYCSKTFKQYTGLWHHKKEAHRNQL